MFEQWKDGKYLPQIKPIKVIGAIDDEIHLKEPLCVIGPVI